MQLLQPDLDRKWMRHALDLAQHAAEAGEVPIGAVLVLNNTVIAEGFNQSIQLCDPSAHAEIRALRAAGLYLKNYRLLNTTLYVTLEPCAMCAGALVHARIHRLVYATPDPKTGCAGSLMNLLQDTRLNHQIECQSGIYAEEAKQLLQAFFQKRR